MFDMEAKDRLVVCPVTSLIINDRCVYCSVICIVLSRSGKNSYDDRKGNNDAALTQMQHRNQREEKIREGCFHPTIDQNRFGIALVGNLKLTLFQVRL